LAEKSLLTSTRCRARLDLSLEPPMRESFVCLFFVVVVDWNRFIVAKRFVAAP